MAAELLHIVYISHETRPLGDDDLREILDMSRVNNAEWGVTGMLLYSEGSFIQVLEGPPEGVREIYEIIHDDPRHTGIVVLAEAYIDQRSFPDWRMGFERVSHPDLAKLIGTSDFLDGISTLPETLGRKPGIAHSLLMTFRNSTALRSKPKAG